jgi:adenine-specific DNA methylase
VVSWFFKSKGYRVLSNDVMRFPALTLRATVGNNDTVLSGDDLCLLMEPNSTRGDYIHRFYAETFGNANSLFLDNWAANIPMISNPMKRQLAVFVPIACITKPLAKYAPIHWTALGTITGYRHLLPQLICDNGLVNDVFNEDSVDLVSRIDADVLYLDPPYACRSGEYEGSYERSENSEEGFENGAAETDRTTDEAVPD